MRQEMALYDACTHVNRCAIFWFCPCIYTVPFLLTGNHSGSPLFRCVSPGTILSLLTVCGTLCFPLTSLRESVCPLPAPVRFHGVPFNGLTRASRQAGQVKATNWQRAWHAKNCLPAGSGSRAQAALPIAFYGVSGVYRTISSSVCLSGSTKGFLKSNVTG